MWRRTLALLAIGVGTPSAAQAWWDAAWTGHVELTVDASAVGGDVGDFPLMLALDASRIDYGLTSAGGADLRVVDSDDSTVLDHEIEVWNPGGTSIVWVRLPTLLGGVTQTVHLYFGNPAAADAQDVPGVWSQAAYQRVLHLASDPPVDSKTGAVLSMTDASVVPGALGDGVLLGASGSVDAGLDLAPYLGNVGTLDFWVRPTATGLADPDTAPAFTGYRRGSNDSQDVVWGWLRDDGMLGMRFGSTSLFGPAPVDDGAWHHVAMRRNAAGTMAVFVDGVPGAVTTVSGTMTGNAITDLGRVIGSNGSPSVTLTGAIDEIRVHSGNRSDVWLVGQYLSMSDQLVSECVWTRSYADGDGDGFGDPAQPHVDCMVPPGFSVLAGDCDDGAGAIFPGAAETVGDGVDQDCDGFDHCYLDGDGDGFSGAGTGPGTTIDCSGLGEATMVEDCDDGAPGTFPGAPESPADGADQDCDGFDHCYRDTDGDGFAGGTNTAGTTLDCSGPGEFSAAADCDDGAPGTFPGAGETAGDGVDQDCDGFDHCYGDGDGDGFAGPVAAPGATLDCSGPGEWATSDDCDDGAIDVFPGAPEVPVDGVDQDCDGFDHCRLDGDGDGFAGPTAGPGTTLDCTGPGESTTVDDCDDGAPGVFPGAPETPVDGADQDCDGFDHCYLDGDGDGFSGANIGAGTTLDCTGAGESTTVDDCDDGAPGTFPGAPEVPADGADQDCDGFDHCYTDGDGDGFAGPTVAPGATLDCSGPGESNTVDDCDDALSTVFPGAAETPVDGIDQDCDGNDHCYLDGDLDGFGRSQVVPGITLDCSGLTESTNMADCNDDDPAWFPGAVEVPVDGLDQDCDGADDCYTDGDGDGFTGPTVAPGTTLDCSGAGESNTIDDCDDSAPGVHPGAPETPLDGVDQDCDGADDCYLDGDGDGSAGPVTGPGVTLDCSGPGESTTVDDCDDGAADVYPGAPEVPLDSVDQDCDGVDHCYLDGDGDDWAGPTIGAGTTLGCSGDGESLSIDDCDDTDPTVFPLAPETPADGVDQDCDGFDHCYVDGDGDGFSGPGIGPGTTLDCTGPGESTTVDDCNDGTPLIYPGAPEAPVDGIDSDCDGFDHCWLDFDLDGFGRSSAVPGTTMDCSGPGESTNELDCDDMDGSAFPGAPETPVDGVDSDCDGSDHCYLDGDGDGWAGSSTGPGTTLDCSGTGESTTIDDCDDAEPATHPGAVDAPADGVDSDCDGSDHCYQDGDGDGFGSALSGPGTTLDCSGPGEAGNALDCDDAAGGIWPGAPETPADGTDQDCDGFDHCYGDVDGDGFAGPTVGPGTTLDCSGPRESTIVDDCDDGDLGVYPGAPEVPVDGTDQDCDGFDHCYSDGDGDGFAGATVIGGTTLDCSGVGESTAIDDCDDVAIDVYPGAPETPADGVDQDCDGVDHCHPDFDGDGFGGMAAGPGTTLDCSGPSEADNASDCDDGAAGTYPGAPESPADGVDQDCDGVDHCYVDADTDGYAGTTSEAGTTLDCTGTGEFVLADDCDDLSALISPAGIETPVDGIDQDCDGGELCYTDDDGDGFGSTVPIPGVDMDCDNGPTESSVDTDCDDAAASTYPGAPETCGDGVDADCNGSDGDSLDSDGDGISASVEASVGSSDCSTDSDGDLIPDAVEYDPPGLDTDGDGVPDIVDTDDDGDGISTFEEGGLDPDGDGIPNYHDLDSDGAQGTDAEEGTGDDDGDGIPNYIDPIEDGLGSDADADGLVTSDELALGLDPTDPDTDGDGVLDGDEAPAFPTLLDTDGDAGAPPHFVGPSGPDAFDQDDDGDGLVSLFETGLRCPGDTLDFDVVVRFTGSPPVAIAVWVCGTGEELVPDYADHDGDGVPDYIDADDDGDGVPTADEDRNGNQDWLDDDLDGDGIVDYLDPNDADGADADADGDGLTNAEEEALGTDPLSTDSDGDGLLDGDEVDRPGSPRDSDGDGIIDALDDDDDGDGLLTADEGTDDFDGDGVPNYLDTDSDDDGILDAVELEDADCDGNHDAYDAVNDRMCGEDTGVEPTGDLSGGCGCSGGSSPASAGLWGLGWALLLVRRRHSSGVADRR